MVSPSGVVSGTVVIAPKLAALNRPTDTPFVFARAAESGRTPLAVLRRQVKDLPMTFALDDSMAMSPASKLLGSPKLVVSARISRSGQAIPESGDLGAPPMTVLLGATDIHLAIDLALPSALQTDSK